MTLPNSITSLIQYHPPGPSGIVLDMFYCIVLMVTSHTRLTARDHGTSSTLVSGKGGAVGPRSLPSHYA